MNSEFTFKTNRSTEDYCNEIADEMLKLFDISRSEAIGRINRQWQDQDMSNDDEHMIFHQLPDWWAKEIYYEQQPLWWTVDLPNSKPYP